MRALKALGSAPAVWHLNEGHAAFVVLQRIRDHIESGLSFDEALEEVRRTTVFTTHTPVPAGHDAFPFSLVETHLAGCWGTLGEYRDRFMQLGAYDNGNGPQFNMTALALRAAKGVNAVSQLHGVVTREMWGPIWPGTPADARPVRAITNGIHMPTWLSNEMARLFDDYLPADWRERHDEPELWARRARHPGRGAVGGAQRAAAVPVRVHPRAGAAPLARGAGQRGARRRRPARCSIPTRSPSASRGASPATSVRS